MWFTARPEPLEFEAWPAEPALRALPSGPASAARDPMLIGLEGEQTDIPPPDDLCGALFDGADGRRVPVAFFTDHYCPNCRTMAGKLSDQDGVAVTLHELPVLGDDSMAAARASLAAERQGKREAFHTRMRRAAFVPTEAYLRDVAESLALDPDRLIADLHDPEVTERLRRDQRLAASLGFAAVPVTVVGRTVVVGDVPARTLGRVIEEERHAAPVCPIRR